jgi:hypothetical protein
MIARAVVFFCRVPGLALDFRPIVAARALAHDPLAPTRRSQTSEVERDNDERQ